MPNLIDDIISYQIENSCLSELEMAHLLEFYVDGPLEQARKRFPGKQLWAPVCLALITDSEGNKKEIYLCEAKGTMKNDNEFPEFTEVGDWVYHCAVRFVSSDNMAIFFQITCNCNDEKLKRQICNGFRETKDGDLLCFVGDFTRECDGRLMSFFNIQYQAERVTCKVYE